MSETFLSAFPLTRGHTWYSQANAGPHAVTGITNATGTLLPQHRQSIDYTAFNKASHISQGTKDYFITYGPDRLRRRASLHNDMADDALMTKYYAFGDFEQETDATGTRHLHYISAGDGLAAVYVKNEGGTDSLYYIMKDHLGSITGAINKETGKVYRQNFDAWGRKRNPQTWTYDDIQEYFPLTRGYTGHEHLDKFGLINMNGRMYDAALCRFLSPDPYVQMPDYSQNFNRYSYALNNPLVYTDPSGELPILIPIIAGAIIGGYLGGAAAEGWEMNPGGWAWDGDTWAGIGIGAVVGAAGGYGFGVGAPALANTGFFAHFGTSGTIAAYTLTGGASGGAIGYGSGFAGGMLYSNGNWQYSHQSGILGGEIGATVGSVVGAAYGLSSPEGRKVFSDMFASPPSFTMEIPNDTKWKGNFYQGSEMDAQRFIYETGIALNVETKYLATNNGYYLERVRGQLMTGGYYENTIRSSGTYSSLEIACNGTYLISPYVSPIIPKASRIFYSVHLHPNNSGQSNADRNWAAYWGIKSYWIGWDGSIGGVNSKVKGSGFTGYTMYDFWKGRFSFKNYNGFPFNQ